MPRFFQRRPWRVFRRVFRWCRIALWLLLLALLSSVLYLNRLGLPEFLKQRLVEELHSRGLDLKFERMRLDTYGGIVVENVQFGRAADTAGPQLFIEQVGLQLQHAALKRFRLEVDSLAIRRGRLVWPLIVSSLPPRQLVVEDINTDLSLLPGDHWQLQQLEARCLGARIHLSGSLANGSAVQEWNFLLPTNRNRLIWQQYLHQALTTAEQIKFSSAPTLNGIWRADARAPNQINARLGLQASDARTPWGDAESFLLTIQSVPARDPTDLLGANVIVQLVQARTPWGQAKDLTLSTQTSPHLRPGAMPGAGLTITAVEPETPWGQARKLQIQLSMPELTTNQSGANVHLEITADSPQTRWGTAQRAQLTAHGAILPDETIPATNESWAAWARLAPYDLAWHLAVDAVDSPRIKVAKISSAGQWRAPELTIETFHAALYGGQCNASARLNVATRELQSEAAIDFDVKQLDQLLTTNAQLWLGQYGWEQPPQVRARAQLVLPEWTNAQPDWRAEVLPTLQLEGAFTNQAGSFRGVSFSSARSSFRLSNFVWDLPDLVAVRPEGQVTLAYTSDSRTQDYYWKIRTGIDVKALKPLFDEKQQEGLEYFQFTGPPALEGELWGRWQDFGRLGFQARVQASNFSFLGERCTELTAALQFTNNLLEFQDVHLRRDDGKIEVPRGHFDFTSQQVFLTNAFSTVEPLAVTRVIGPETTAAIEPFRFLAPPAVRVNGVIPVRDMSGVDLRFEVEGGPFRYLKFNLPQVRAELFWRGDALTVTNFQGDFYGGQLNGDAQFDFSPAAGADFQFHATMAEAELKKLMTDWSSASNRLEGIVKGQLTVTAANSSDWKSWQGHGQAGLRDGLIWDVPLFGIFSAPLNAIAPGLGNSRASAGAATFTLTNSVIHTDDLEIHATGLRLQYRGTVDFQGQVNARAEAELLRDTWLVGRVISLAFMPLTKLFEYKVTGTVNQPKREPLYLLPRIVLMPLHPWRTLKDMFPPETPPPAPSPPPPEPPKPPPSP